MLCNDMEQQKLGEGRGGNESPSKACHVPKSHRLNCLKTAAAPNIPSWMLEIPFLHELLKDPIIIIIITGVKNQSSGDLKRIAYHLHNAATESGSVEKGFSE
jgi:hypothetical protein